MKYSYNLKQKSYEADITPEDLEKRILETRGVDNPEMFFDPPHPYVYMKDLKDIFGDFHKGFEEVRKLILQAISNDEVIIIYGDYDVDGISSVAILWNLLYNVKDYKNTRPFIPDRFKHGYGLSRTGIDDVKKLISKEFPDNPAQSPLIISVDCGITNVSEVDYARSLGFKIAILDHHTLAEDIPDANSIIQTTRMCAGGITYFFSSYMLGKSDEASLDLAALATVADLQPVLGINRSIVKHGLRKMEKDARVGIDALKRASGLFGKQITPGRVGWILAPRLNASGRLESALDSLRILCTGDGRKAHDIAMRLNSVNSARQRLTNEIFDKVIGLVDDSGEKKVIVVSGRGFHEGVIGLVASKLSKIFHKPAIVISEGDKISKASARSIGNIDITSLLKEAGDVFESLGGHKAAAGFSIKTARIDEIKEKIYAAAEHLINEDLLKPKIDIDIQIPFSLISAETFNIVKKFEPFGIGNPDIVFLTRDLVVLESSLFGMEANHASLKVSHTDDKDRYVFAKVFGKGREVFEKTAIGTKVDLVYTLSENVYRGKSYIDLMVKDLVVTSA